MEKSIGDLAMDGDGSWMGPSLCCDSRTATPGIESGSTWGRDREETGHGGIEKAQRSQQPR